MSATITWTIEWMQCVPQDGPLTDVVISAGWRCSGVQTENGKEYFGAVFAVASFPQPTEGGSFTPYADLTQDQVLGWCWSNGVNKDSSETSVQQQIDDQINPPVIQPPLPWATPAA